MGIKELLSGASQAIMPFAKKVPLHPNVLTLFSLLLALAATVFIYSGNVLLAAGFVALAYLMDGVDGLVARARKLETAFGAYFDGVSDRIVDFFVLLAMMTLVWPSQQMAHFAIILLMAFGVFLTTFAVAYADHRGAVRKEDLKKMKCIFERPERCVAILASLVAYAYDPQVSFYILAVAAALSVAAFLQRFVKAAEINMGYR
ncbi:MAG: CDP-alcohol phosphatidyltransferase family protein [Candidatus Micrarchaeota archaeon]|nr:CDP-alcohol phosphatidyltransferase family protein [Candidatus Micrarchaeota archaeon]